MDWNLKAPSWDLSEVDEANLPNIEEEAAVDVGGSSRFGVYRIKGEFSVDLKLGQVGNSATEQVVAKHKDAAAVGAASKMASPLPPGSSKRARAVNNGSQRVSCLVDGCNSDLSACRDYHRRHKVCEQHSKTAQVTIGGLKQRFCQQCSRFHSLEEFDEGKRSCRKRLDGHNRRRRKAQPESLTRSGGFLSNYQGTQLLPFSSSHVFPSSGVVNPGWSGGGVVTSCGDVRLHSHSHSQSHNNQQVHMVDHKQELFLGTSPTSSCYKEGKQLAYLQPDPSHNNQNPHLPTASVCQTLLRNSNNNNNNSSPFQETTGGLRCKIFCDNINSLTSSVHDSSCALSLLSSPPPPPPPHQTHNPMVQHHHHHHSSSSSSLMQPLGLSLHDSSSMDPVLGAPHNGSDHCSSMYSMEDSHGSQGNEAPQLFPFQWE